jgi:hypothetical protein
MAQLFSRFPFIIGKRIFSTFYYVSRLKYYGENKTGDVMHNEKAN